MMTTESRRVDDTIATYEKKYVKDFDEQQVIAQRIEIMRKELPIGAFRAVIRNARMMGTEEHVQYAIADSDWVDGFLYDAQTEILQRFAMLERAKELDAAQDPEPWQLEEVSGW